MDHGQNHSNSASREEKLRLPMRLSTPLSCWHESPTTARMDSLLELCEVGGFFGSNQPLPMGTRIFVEIRLFTQPEPTVLGLEAIVGPLSGYLLPEETGFQVRFQNLSIEERQVIRQFLEMDGNVKAEPSNTQWDSLPPIAFEEAPVPQPEAVALSRPGEPTEEIAAPMMDDRTLPYGVERQTVNEQLVLNGGQSLQENDSDIHPLLRPPAPAETSDPAYRAAERSTTDVVNLEGSQRVKTIPFGSSPPVTAPVRATPRPGVFNETMEFGTDELMAAMKENTERHETNSWIQAMESPNWPPQRGSSLAAEEATAPVSMELVSKLQAAPSTGIDPAAHSASNPKPAPKEPSHGSSGEAPRQEAVNPAGAHPNINSHRSADSNNETRNPSGASMPSGIRRKKTPAPIPFNES
jgi:hypothetical protein